MLMGDPTDYIPGLPKVPLVAKEMFGIYRGGFGPKKAYACLRDCTDYITGLALVMTFYEAYFKEFIDRKYPHAKVATWDGHIIVISWRSLLLEQGRLLWMRRTGTELWGTSMQYDKLEEELWKNYKCPTI